jgi:DNA-binding CsgD family transcriptional regulator
MDPGSQQILENLAAMAPALSNSANIGALFARAADLTCRGCGFSRGVILSIEDGVVTATHTQALSDHASDLLRRRVLDQPIALVPGTEEAILLQRGSRPPEVRAATRSVLAEQLELGEYVLSPLTPGGVPLALLALDGEKAVADGDLALVDAFAGIIRLAIELVVARDRVADVASAFRFLSVSADAFVQEATRAPFALPERRGARAAFPVFAAGPLPIADSPLSERETTIMVMLAQGRSNREIADRLIVSPETVKTQVASILRKLDATNRAEAVAKYVAFSHSNP